MSTFYIHLSEGSAHKLVADLSLYSMHSLDALGMHLIIITFDRYFCSHCARADMALTLPHPKTCSRVFIFYQVLPAQLHCHEQSTHCFPKDENCVEHPSVPLELVWCQCWCDLCC